jgi:hypothetical protein
MVLCEGLVLCGEVELFWRDGQEGTTALHCRRRLPTNCRKAMGRRTMKFKYLTCSSMLERLFGWRCCCWDVGGRKEEDEVVMRRTQHLRFVGGGARLSKPKQLYYSRITMLIINII